MWDVAMVVLLAAVWLLFYEFLVWCDGIVHGREEE